MYVHINLIRFFLQVSWCPNPSDSYPKLCEASLQMQLRKALQLHDEELTRLRAQTDVLETKEGISFGVPGDVKNVDSRYGDIVSQHSPVGLIWIGMWMWNSQLKTPLFIKTARQRTLERAGRIRSETCRWESSWRMLQSTKNVWMTVSFSPEPSWRDFRFHCQMDTTWSFQVSKVWPIFTLATLRCQEVDKKCQKHAEMLASLEAT